MTEIINKIDTLIVIYSDDNPLYKEVNKKRMKFLMCKIN